MVLVLAEEATVSLPVLPVLLDAIPCCRYRVRAIVSLLLRPPVVRLLLSPRLLRFAPDLKVIPLQGRRSVSLLLPRLLNGAPVATRHLYDGCPSFGEIANVLKDLVF